MTSRKKHVAKASPKKVSAARRQSGALAPSAVGEVEPLINRVVEILEEARSQVVRAVNTTMVLAYWHVGREIVEFVQHGDRRAGYGERVLDVLSEHLRTRIGRGYSTTNLRYFRAFYLAYRERKPEIRHIGGGELGARRSGRCPRHSPQAKWRFWYAEPRRLLACARLVPLPRADERRARDCPRVLRG